MRIVSFSIRPSIHAIFNNTNATTLPRNSNAILAIFCPRVGYEFFLDQKYEEKGRGGDALRDKIDGQF